MNQSYQAIYQKVMRVLIDLLSNIKYTDANGTIKNIRVIPGSHEKIIHEYLYNEKRKNGSAVSNLLPAITILLESATYAPTMRLNNILNIKMLNGDQYSPVPIQVTYKCSFHSHTLNVMMYMMEQIQTIFDPTFSIDIRYFNDMESISTPISMSMGGLTQESDYGIDADRILSCDFTLTIFCHIFKKIQDKEAHITLDLNLGGVTLAPRLDEDIPIGDPIFVEGE